MTTDESIRYASEGALARITIDRPPLNVLTIDMLDGLRRAFERAAADGEVRVVVLRAGGKLFSAGVDVADHVGDRVQLMMDSLARLFVTMDGLDKPTVSVVHGAALGGGCELTLATDLCFASERASFGQPEIRLGLFAPPASVLLPRLIGERQALWMLLSGETITASQALSPSPPSSQSSPGPPNSKSSPSPPLKTSSPSPPSNVARGTWPCSVSSSSPSLPLTVTACTT